MKGIRNILILSAGRRVELVKAFKSEVKSRGIKSKIFAADLLPELSAACKVADSSFALPKIGSTGYIETLKYECLQKSIGLIIPTIDTELLVLSDFRDEFAKMGIDVVISDRKIILACRDKRQTAQLFQEYKIPTPKLYNKEELVFPLFVKPYDGSSSLGAMKIDSPEGITSEISSNPKTIYMEFVGSEYDEYTIDLYYDRNSLLKCLVPRKRLQTRTGEILKGVTKRNHLYDILLKKMSNIPGFRGCVTLQAFYRPDSYYAIEINPRFGGGYPLSYEAGANYPGYLIDEYFNGSEIHFIDDWESNLLMLRYDAHVLVHNYE